MRTITLVVYVEDEAADAIAMMLETAGIDIEEQPGVVASECWDEETDAEDEGHVRNNAEYKG